MFSNGLIACFVFMGIGTLLDVGFVMARPFQSMIIALFAELGTVVVFPLAVAMGLNPGQAAAVATIGGADGPMVLFTSLQLAREIVRADHGGGLPVSGLTYGGYPYLIKLMIPEHLRALPMPMEKTRTITSNEKLVFAVIACVLLSLLFPVASPLLLSLFVGVVIRESDLPNFYELFSNTVLYGATFFLGLLLGVLCEAGTILNPVVLKLLVLGILALLISGIGGILGGYVLYYWSGKKYNPVIGIAGRQLRADHRQGGAEIGGAGGHHPAARAGRQYQWRDHQRHFRGDLNRVPAAGDAERLIHSTRRVAPAMKSPSSKPSWAC
jgi:Na+-transporting methylmalonyl-CoA/oxaloacetate decarboxylase beta subunit